MSNMNVSLSGIAGKSAELVGKNGPKTPIAIQPPVDRIQELAEAADKLRRLEEDIFLHEHTNRIKV